MKTIKFQKYICMMLSLLIAISTLTGCFGNATKNTMDDVLTLKAGDEKRTQITLLVKYAFSADAFEKAVEEAFPDVDIVQVGNYTSNTTLAKEYEKRLKHDDITDMVMTWPANVGEEYFDERLIDLSGMPFTSNYKTSILDSIAKNDKLYYLPGPATIRGFIYNKTLFAENGWEVPHDYDGFIALCKQIAATGLPPVQFSFGNPEVLDTVFTGFSYASCYSKPDDMEWLYRYNEKQEGNFIDHFEPALQNFQTLIDENIIHKDQLPLYYPDVQKNLFTRKTAMIEDSLLLVDLGRKLYNSTDEFAIMPFYNKESDWARIYMTCFIGLNKHLQEPDQKEKFDKVMEIMKFISTPEGQDALAGGTAMYSSLKEMDAPDIVEIEALAPALNQGRYATFPTLTNASNALHEGLKEMLQGNRDIQAIASKIDAENREKKDDQNLKKLGEAKQNFTMIETGSLFCDAMRAHADSDIALFLDNGKDGRYNGKGISAKFYQGDVTQEDIQRIFPDLKLASKGELWLVSMLGKDIMHTLEYTLDVNNGSNWFYYFSGLKLKFHPLQEQGKRITNVTLENGEELEMDKTYTVAVMEDSVPSNVIASCKKTGVLIQDIIISYIKEKKIIAPLQDERFQIVLK